VAGPVDERVGRELDKLVGLDLAGAGRAADMRMFDFGPRRPKTSRHRPERPAVMVGEFALHIQCPWRVEGPGGIVTGRADLWEPLAGCKGHDLEGYQRYDYDQEPNVQDLRVAEWLGDPDAVEQRRVPAARRKLVVLAVRATPCCGAEIDLTDGYRLTLFPDGSVGEDWRIFRPHEKDGPHFVVSGGRVDGDG
jgi:hypothetical protein